MTLSIKEYNEFSTYGKTLDGTESELDLVKLSRINFLKQKMRAMLAAEIGDTPDNLADAIRAIVLGEAIRMGLVTDKATIEKHGQYIAALLDGYGGGESIADVLLGNLTPIHHRIVLGYFVAKSNIIAADNEEDVRMVDIDPQVEE